MEAQARLHGMACVACMGARGRWACHPRRYQCRRPQWGRAGPRASPTMPRGPMLATFTAGTLCPNPPAGVFGVAARPQGGDAAAPGQAVGGGGGLGLKLLNGTNYKGTYLATGKVEVRWGDAEAPGQAVGGYGVEVWWCWGPWPGSPSFEAGGQAWRLGAGPPAAVPSYPSPQPTNLLDQQLTANRSNRRPPTAGT